MSEENEANKSTTMARRTIYRSTAHELTDGMREFLERQPFAMLATYNLDDSIHVVPLSYMFEDGRFFFATASSSRKARNLAARPEATVTVDDRSTLEWVSAMGTAVLIRGQRSREINARLYHRSWTDVGLATVGPFLERHEDVTIAITPHRWSAWDTQSTFFVALQDAGIPLDDAESWFQL
jgi:nitroimidazol reductase NimA-like FMN-containing flavoprotein (pyridoxamine 5'-phosphate oxidase superfamily)